MRKLYDFWYLPWMCSRPSPLRTLPLGAERIGSILNLSFVKLLKRVYAQ